MTEPTADSAACSSPPTFRDPATGELLFFVDGATDDPTGCRIPFNAELLVQMPSPAAHALKLWRNYAQMQIGADAMKRLHDNELMVVPRQTWNRAMAIIQERRDHSAKSSGTE